MHAGAGDELTVLDISLADNRDALLRRSTAGATLPLLRSPFRGRDPDHPASTRTSRSEPGVCTSLLVDEYLGGRFRAWAVVAAFGDNLPQEAAAALRAARHEGRRAGDTLRALGECLNYNAYGDAVEDLHFLPAELYRRLRPSPIRCEFAAQDPAFQTLRAGYRRISRCAQRSIR